MISPGLDWSGSPGREPHDPLLVFAIVHFAALGKLAMDAHVHIFNKATWTDQYMRQSSGADRICDGLITLVLG